MRKILVALAGAFLYAAAPAMAQTAEGGAKTLQLSKVILDTQSAPIKGKIKGGTLCVFPSKWDVAGSKKSQDYERYDLLFSDKLKSAGYNVVTVSANMFASEDDKNRADFLVGATIRPDTINLCSSVSGEKGNVLLAVDWQVYDRAAQKVVATLTTTGYGVQEKFSRDGLTAMWNQAFSNALGALSDQGVLQAQPGSAVSQNASPPIVPPPAPTGG
jgi:hypothetical protein